MLVPSLAAPARTIRVPEVMSRSATVTGMEAVPFEFPATHVVLSWMGHENLSFRIRGVGSDGTRDEWLTVVEAHDLEKGRRHYSGVIAVDRAAWLEWVPLLPRSKSLDRLQVFYMNTTDGPIIEHRIPATAAAQASAPDIVTRAEWGADESLKSTSGGCDRDFYPLQQLFVHHTAGSENGPDYTDDMRAIYTFHTKGRGWCDVGYNFVIAPDGTLFEGRWARRYSDWELHNSEDRAWGVVAGAHVANFNSGSLGVSMMGTYTTAKLTEAARSSLVETLAWIADRHDLDPTATHIYDNPSSGLTKKLPVIAGHRDAGQTACPGDTVYKNLPKLRQDVALRMGTGRASTLTTLGASASKITYGADVAITGALTSEGIALAGRTVQVYSRKSGSWTLLQTLVTSSDGTFGLTVSPKRTTRYEARFEGDSVLWDSASGRRSVRVQPTVSLTTGDGTGSEDAPVTVVPGTRVTLGGEVTPSLNGRTLKIKIFVRRADGSEVLVREKAVITSSGEYQTTYRPRKPGKTYRAVTWFPTGGGFAAARSNPVFFSLPG